ncbi:MAG: hypothetical protein HY328_17140 [Chloroflexi bacterium]|nr:hypothetical protein [Chloroflexota bacterium]
MTVTVLVQALQNALPDDSPIRRNARALQEEFASLGGVPASAIELFHDCHRPDD